MRLSVMHKVFEAPFARAFLEALFKWHLSLWHLNEEGGEWNKALLETMPSFGEVTVLVQVNFS